jgi:hypothetical protein
MKATRRSFLITSIGAVSALALSREALADAPMLSETDPTAVALGYKSDATKVDKAKYPKYAAGQDCAACMLYQGKKGSASGPCGAFPASRCRRRAGAAHSRRWADVGGGIVRCRNVAKTAKRPPSDDGGRFYA